MSEISRRDFLKLGGLGAAAALLLKLRSTGVSAAPYSEKSKFEPQTVNGVEVYGLDEPLSSELDVRSLYAYLDIKFSEKWGFKIGDKVEQRKKYLDKDKRYLEVVVRKSAYDSFSREQSNTGVDFPSWVRAHIDLSNRCMKNAKPSSAMRGELRRIVIIDDQFANTIWDEDSYRKGKGQALDAAWRSKFYGGLPLDVDASWAIADDYRDGAPNMWTVRQNKDLTSVTKTKDGKEQVFTLPNEEDFLKKVNGVKLDMNLIHELSHYLFSLPDEYTMDVYDNGKNGFARYLWSTGSYAIPYLSPYLSYLTKRNFEEQVRALGKKEFQEHPQNTTVTVPDSNPNPRSAIEIRKVRLLENSIYGSKEFASGPDQSTLGNSITFSNDLFKGDGNSWLLTKIEDGVSKPLFFPAACLNICEIAGLQSVDLKVNFFGNYNPTKPTQELVPIDRSDFDQFMSKIKGNGWEPYASMEIPGTSTMFVWYLSDRLDTFYG